MLKKYFQVWWLQALYIFIAAGFVSLLYLYFVKNEVSFSQIMLADAVSLLLVTIYITFRGKMHSRHTMTIGFFLVSLCLLVLLLPLAVEYKLYIFFILAGFAAIMFFTPYNILYFRGIKEDHHMQSMTFYWAVMIITAVVSPFVAAYIWTNSGLTPFISVAVIISLIAIYLTKYLPKQTYTYSIKHGWNFLKGFRLITMLDGALHRATGVVVVLYSLQYITNEFDFGKFLSLMALAALVIAFPMAKLSDKWHKRTVFIWSTSLLAALIVFSFYFVDNFLWFFILAMMLRGLMVLNEPLRSNIILDKEKEKAIVWISREIFLHLGRAILVFILAGMLYLGYHKETFILMGALHLLFPLLVYKEKVYATPN